VVQLPDSLRQQLAPVVKYHFWILAALVPLLLLPALFLANGERRAAIARGKSAIDGHVSALNAVRNEPDHPNAAWTEAIDRQTQTVKEELLAEWTALWESQRPLRVWPERLGPDFLAAIEALQTGGRRDLQFRDLQRYQNTVPDIVRGLPARMGCEETMTETEGQFGPGRPQPGAGPDGGEDPEASLSLVALEWKSEDQKRLFGSFVWSRPPSTVQVLLAQEELWVYGLFCDAIKQVNAGSTALFDSRITTVEELAVGYPAAEEKPGGQGTGRVFAGRPSLGRGAGGGFDEGLPASDSDFGSGGGAPRLEERPPHPRFSGTPGEVEDRGDAGGSPGGSPDDPFKQWIYVDFAGRPLTARDIATKPEARFVHLMPFVLRLVMDQRQVDRLLVELASCPVPIDVRQVRINPTNQGSGPSVFEAGGGADSAGMAVGSGLQDRRQRPFDVTVELRGTVGLATPPDPAALGPSAAADQAGNEDGGI